MNLIAKATAAAHASTSLPSVEPITRFPGQRDLLSWCQDMGPGTAILLILVGMVFLLYGWSIFKPLVTLNAIVLGGYLGALIGQRYGGHMLAGGLIGSIAAAATTWPLMKWAVAVMGGIVGAFAGASVWLTINGLDPHYAWAGAMTGLVAFGLFSFILFRGSIIMYTSLQGSLMAVAGVLGLIFKYPDFTTRVSQSLSKQPLLLPVLVVIAAGMGLIFQQTHSGAGGGDATPAGGEKK
jgi:hypothetical protein